MQKSLDSLALFIIGIILFTFGLASQEIIGFESRFYLFALEMWRHGPTWFPTTYHQPYPDYPATSTYLIYLTAHLFGGLNKLTAVFPSAVAAALTVVVTYLIGAEHQRKWGWCAAFFLLFTLTFITEARTISIDQYVAAITTTCFYLVMREKSLFFIFLMLVIGFAFRGPIGFIIPTAVVSTYYLLEKKYKSFFIFGLSALVLLIMCCAILFALAHHVGGTAFVHDVINMEIGSRLQDVSAPPLWFYFTECLGGYAVTFPLAILIVAGCLPFLFKSTTTEIRFLRQCLAWILIILIGMSIPGDKKMRYVLAIAPALALLCSYLHVGSLCIGPGRNNYLYWLRRIFDGICFAFPLLALWGLAWLFQKDIDFGLNYILLISVFLILQLIIFFIPTYEVGVLGVAALTFFLANVFIIEKINLHLNQTKKFVLAVENIRAHSHSSLIFFQEGKDGLPIKYLVNTQAETMPIYLYNDKDLLRLKKSTLVIVGKENMPHISREIMQHFHIIATGKIGHDEVVVLNKK